MFSLRLVPTALTVSGLRLQRRWDVVSPHPAGARCHQGPAPHRAVAACRHPDPRLATAAEFRSPPVPRWPHAAGFCGHLAPAPLRAAGRLTSSGTRLAAHGGIFQASRTPSPPRGEILRPLGTRDPLNFNQIPHFLWFFAPVGRSRIYPHPPGRKTGDTSHNHTRTSEGLEIMIGRWLKGPFQVSASMTKGLSRCDDKRSVPLS